MGRRKKEAASMGRSLIKDRFQGKSVRRGGDSFLHTTELNDGYEARNVNLSSLTEQTSMAEFLSTAEMAGRDFTAEKENVQLVTPLLNSGVMSKEALKKVKDTQDLHRNLLRIPRRPAWTEDTPADKLQQDERASFLEWRRQLAKLQEEEHIVITPYEKNLEFWRQLWRVIERSDVVVQIVDARHPLLFWCRDLDAYVREVDPRKHCMLLVNKADLLTLPQREAWAEYFASQGVNVVFWSAVEEAARLEREEKSASAQEDKSVADEEEEEGHVHRNDASTDEDNDNNDDDDKEVNSEGNKHDTAVTTKPQRTNDVKSDDIKDDGDDDDGTKGSEDPAPATNTVSCDDSERKSDTAAKDDKLSASEHSDSVKKSSSDTQNTTPAVEDGCEGDVEDDNDDDDDDEGDDDDQGEENEDSDGYETIEETTDDEGDDDEGEDDGGDRRGSSKPDDAKSLESPSSVSHKDEAPPLKPVAVADSRLQTSGQLLSLFRRAARTQHQEGVTTVGMVGYPNVGKSSTINTILRDKKVPVSATPGRTKHFQTLYVEKDLLLCDCPGLVFPSFVNSKADLVVNGILPIDHLQDSEPPVELVCQSVGRAALEGLYHLNLPPPEEWEDPDTPPSAYHLLEAYGALRGFMSHKGNPDRPRAARYILKDFVNGKLLFCHPPPGIDSALFQKPPYTTPRPLSHVPKACTMKPASQIKSEALAQEFFNQVHVKARAIGPRAVSNQVRMEGLRPVAAGQGQGQGQGQSCESSATSLQGSQTSLAGKPWKKHNNRNKKEKLRRVHKDLDMY